MTLYYNHIITIIIATTDIVTLCHFMDHCDYFSYREFYVLVSDFTVETNQDPPQGSEWWVAGSSACCLVRAATSGCQTVRVGVLALGSSGEMEIQGYLLNQYVGQQFRKVWSLDQQC